MDIRSYNFYSKKKRKKKKKQMLVKEKREWRLGIGEGRLYEVLRKWC